MDVCHGIMVNVHDKILCLKRKQGEEKEEIKEEEKDNKGWRSDSRRSNGRSN